MEEFNNEVNEPEITATEPTPAPEAAPTLPKKRFSLSIVGFILGLVSVMEGFSLIMIPYLVEIEKGYYRSQYAGTNTRVTFDTTLVDMLSTILLVFVFLVATAAIILAIIGLIQSARKSGNKKGIVFSAIGIAAAIIAVIISFAAGVKMTII